MPSLGCALLRASWLRWVGWCLLLVNYPGFSGLGFLLNLVNGEDKNTNVKNTHTCLHLSAQIVPLKNTYVFRWCLPVSRAYIICGNLQVLCALPNNSCDCRERPALLLRKQPMCCLPLLVWLFELLVFTPGLRLPLGSAPSHFLSAAGLHTLFGGVKNVKSWLGAGSSPPTPHSPGITSQM